MIEALYTNSMVQNMLLVEEFPGLGGVFTSVLRNNIANATPWSPSPCPLPKTNPRKRNSSFA